MPGANRRVVDEVSERVLINAGESAEPSAVNAMQWLERAAVTNSSLRWEKVQPLLEVDTDLNFLRSRQDFIDFVRRVREKSSAAEGIR